MRPLLPAFFIPTATSNAVTTVTRQAQTEQYLQGCVGHTEWPKRRGPWGLQSNVFSEAQLRTADQQLPKDLRIRNVTVACIHRTISGVTVSHSDRILFCSFITYGPSVKNDRPRMTPGIKINEWYEKQTHLLALSHFHGNFYAQKYICERRDFWTPCIWHTIKQNINMACRVTFFNYRLHSSTQNCVVLECLFSKVLSRQPTYEP